MQAEGGMVRFFLAAPERPVFGGHGPGNVIAQYIPTNNCKEPTWLNKTSRKKREKVVEKRN